MKDKFGVKRECVIFYRDWLKSIKNKEIREICRTESFIAGGSIVSLFLGEKVNDYDIYFTSQEAAETVGNYMKKQEDCVFETERSITMKDKIQLIIGFYGSPWNVIDQFDFVHTHCYYYRAENHLQVTSEAMEHICARRLKFHYSEYPFNALMRVRKFLRREWKIRASEMLKLTFSLAMIDWSSPKVLKDQLNGVDIIYCQEIIARLKDEDQEISLSDITAIVNEIEELAGHNETEETE